MTRLIKVRMNEKITREVKTPNVIESDVEVNNEELSLAKEFGAVTLQGLGKKSAKNPSSRVTSSYSLKLKKHVTLKMLGLSTWILLVQPLPRNIEKEATQVTKQNPSGPLEKKKEHQIQRLSNPIQIQKGFR